MTRDEVVNGLRLLPAELASVIEGLSRDRLRARPEAHAWSILEGCCHLRDAAEIEHARIVRIAAEDEPLIVTWDQEGFARNRAYNEQDIDAVQATLHAWWDQLAELIAGLPADAWKRTARHEERGVITLGWRAQRQVEHPREHFEQMRVVRARV